MEPEKKEPTQPTPAAEPKETKDEKSTPTDEGGRAGALEKATDEVDGEYLKPNWD